MLTYPEILQTISTLGGLVGVGTAVYATFIGKKVHKTLDDVHQTIKDQQKTDRP